MSAKVSAGPSVYMSHGRYYFKIMENGDRVTVATRKTDRAEAEAFRDAYMARHIEEPGRKPATFGELLKRFTEPEKNPKYIESLETGASYTFRYAKYEAIRAGHILSLADPLVLQKHLDKLTKGDIEGLRRAVHRKFGNRPVAHDTFRTLKTILICAYGKGWMKNDIAYRMPGIKATKSEKTLLLPVEDIKYIYSRPNHFRRPVERDIFYILAATGMRRAELAAIQGRQVKRALINGREVDVLVVDQAFKDDNYREVSTPKWDVTRTIPLAPSVAKVLRNYLRGPDTFLFSMGNSQWTDMFNYIRSAVDPKRLEAPEALKDLTAHKLRHRLNTSLIEADVRDILIQEYLSWHHQDQNKVQAGYTHLYIKSLLEVADKIEELYGFDSMTEEEKDDIIWLD